MVEYYPLIGTIEYMETDPDGVIASGEVFHDQMRISDEQHRLELLERSRQHLREMKPPVLRYNLHGYPQLQYFCKNP
jgi:hypothetical protein